MTDGRGARANWKHNREMVFSGFELVSAFQLITHQFVMVAER